MDELLQKLSITPGCPDYSKEEDFINVLVNGAEKKIFEGWLNGTGRAAGTILAKMILGTQEGLQGTCELTIDNKLAPLFDVVILWLATGDRFFSPTSDLAARSRKLYALAAYFGLSNLQALIQRNGWNTGSLLDAADKIGMVCTLVPWKEFGFILDKETRQEVWFHYRSVVQSDSSTTGLPFEVGTEVLYDFIEKPRKGRKPNSPKALNIRSVSGVHFRKFQSNFY